MTKVQIHWSDIEKSDTLGEHIEKHLERALKHHGERFLRVDVHIHDDKGGRSGANDKRFVIEGRPSGGEHLAVEHQGEDFYATATEAVKKFERAVHNYIERERQH